MYRPLLPCRMGGATELPSALLKWGGRQGGEMPQTNMTIPQNLLLQDSNNY